jgi:hypothetical protein
MPTVPFAALVRSSPTRRLWYAGGALFIFLFTLLIGNSVISRDRAVTSNMVGHDFLAFYTAGSFVRDGRSRELYKLEPVRKFEQSTGHAAGLEIGDSFGPWWNPPFYALVFEPLAALPYRSALNVWRWIGLAAVAGAMAFLMSMLPKSWATRGLVPLLVVTSMPFVQAFTHGQNTFTSLLLLTAAVWFWRGGQALRAGLVGGLLFYKPQLGAVVAAVMIFDLGPQAIGGFAITGIGLLAVTVLAMPGSLGDWIHGLPANVRWMQIDHDYLWERHVTIKAFWRLLFQGRAAGEPFWATTILTDACLAAVVGAGLWAVWMSRLADGHARRLNRDRLISATIVTMPLLMPFYFDYDLLLLAVPATLYAMDQNRDRRVTAAWAVLYLWLFVNPAVGLHTHVDGTVIILSFIAAMMIGRVAKREAVQEERWIIDPVVEPMRLAA